MNPTAANPPQGAVTFDLAIQELATYRLTAAHALQIGVIPDEILDYVRGAVTPAQRSDIQATLVRSPWAQDRVVALVKAKKDPSSLGARTLKNLSAAFAWFGGRTGDRDQDLAHLLDQVN